jgi:two-component sensor histidine kinase
VLSNAVYLVIIVLAGSITTAMAVHLWVNRKIIEPDVSILLLTGLWVWITFQIGECIFPSLAVKIVLYKVKFAGISIASASVFGFCYEFMTDEKRIDSRFFFILLCPAIAFNVLSFFPFFESLFWKRIFIAPNYLLLDIEPNTGYILFNCYCVALILSGFTLILVSLFRKDSQIRVRMAPFLFAAILCTAAGLADFLFKRELFYYRILPVAFSFSTLTVIYYLRLRYFRTIPLAQHTINESMSDCLLIVSPDNTVIYMNPVAYSLFKVPPISVLGKKLDRYMGGLSVIINRIDTAEEHVDIYELDERVFDVRVSLITNRRGKMVNKIIILRDVTRLKRVEENLREMKEQLEVKVAERTRELAQINESLKIEVKERKKAEEIIKAALEEKSVLLGELHHRVKNNLQIVSSLLKLQSHDICDPKAREIFNVSISRIRSIAMVHEKLYKSEDISRTRFDVYLDELVRSIVFSHSEAEAHISVSLKIEPVRLDINSSINAGLIVNELVLNSLKHAFPPEEGASGSIKKEIEVEFRNDNGYYVLIVGDNGRGMPEGVTDGEPSKLGMKIITTLVKQLSGTMETLRAPGNRVHIRFPAAEKPAQT